MPPTEKDLLAAEVEERWLDFEEALSNKRKYPVRQFTAFWNAAKRYAEYTRRDPLLHRVVLRALYGLADFVSCERKRVPDQVVLDAQRLESIVFAGYDPHFEGDEPPGQ